MSFLRTHLICLALVGIDLVARTWRIQWILDGLHFRIPFGQLFAVNVIGDAGAAITPLRLGGEPARLAALAHDGVPLSAGLVALGFEVVVMWPVIIAVAGGLAVLYAPDWWHAARPALAHTVRSAWPWVAVVVAASAAGWWGGRRLAPRVSHLMRRGMRRALAYGRRMPRWPLLAGIPLTLVSLAARVAILPVLALALPNPPALGPLCFASFALLYAQLLLPTPSGAGVVELGFLGGAVGDLGEHYGSILLIWRFYTTFVLVALGVVLAARHYGRAALSALLGGRSGADALPEQE